MDITGDDHVIFSFGCQASGIRRFVNAIQQRWPLLSIDYTEPDLQRVFAGEHAAADCERTVRNRERSSLYFYCEEGLRIHHEDYGYTLTDGGIGPFAVFVRNRRNIEFQLGKVLEVYSNSDLSVAGAPDPYSAWLATPQMAEITLVTPSHAYISEFSNHILSTLLSCIRSGGSL